MSFSWKRVVLATVTTLTLGGVAQASEASLRRIADYGNEQFDGRDFRLSESWSERRDPDRFDRRPSPDWQKQRHRWSGDYDDPRRGWSHWRPVFAGPGWGYRDRCRIIINERVNRWGERVQVRREVCR